MYNMVYCTSTLARRLYRGRPAQTHFFFFVISSFLEPRMYSKNHTIRTALPEQLSVPLVPERTILLSPPNAPCECERFIPPPPRSAFSTTSRSIRRRSMFCNFSSCMAQNVRDGSPNFVGLSGRSSWST